MLASAPPGTSSNLETALRDMARSSCFGWELILVRFKYFGPNLKYFRALRHLTQDGLARSVTATRRWRGFSQTYISRLERGMRPSREEHVDALAVALQVPASALLSRPRIVRATEGRPVIVANAIALESGRVRRAR